MAENRVADLLVQVSFQKKQNMILAARLSANARRTEELRMELAAQKDLVKQLRSRIRVAMGSRILPMEDLVMGPE